MPKTQEDLAHTKQIKKKKQGKKFQKNKKGRARFRAVYYSTDDEGIIDLEDATTACSDDEEEEPDLR